MELAGVDGGDGESDGGDGVAGAEEDVGIHLAHRRHREPEPAAPALHRLKRRQCREARSGAPALTLRASSRSAPRSRPWRKPSLSTIEMEDGTGGDAAVVGGASVGGGEDRVVRLLLLFLQSLYYIELIWLKDLTRGRRGERR